MNKARYNQIVDSTYKSYLRKAKNQTTEDLFGSMIKGDEIIHGMLEAHTRDFITYTREQFIDKCKTDKEFSEKWGLKIEERELAQRERVKLLQKAWKSNGISPEHEEVSTMWIEYKNLMEKYNIPTKLITVTYKDEKLEIYE
jgi:hypothetical protein